MPASFEPTVIPTPRKVRARRGHWTPARRLLARVSPEAADLGEFLHGSLDVPGARTRKIELRDDAPDRPHLRLHVAGAGNRLAPARSLSDIPVGAEGYRLTVAASGVLIEARERAGLYYGLMTLRQLARNHTPIPCCVIEDWPDMPVRGVHMDLKGCTPTVEYMRGLIRRLSEYKVNTLLMEYENAVALDATAGVEKPSAWSKRDVESLAELARRHFITLMPLVQSLGHVEYILRHDAYRRYRESRTNLQQYCPTRPETFEFWKAQADEIIELFPESPYFHVGADETRLLGHCPKCRARVEAGEDELGLYLGYMKRVWGHILDRGHLPVFWDDIVSRAFTPARMRRIPRDVVPMVWLYTIGDDGAPTFHVRSGRYQRREFLRHETFFASPGPNAATAWLDEMSRSERRNYGPYIEDDETAPLIPSAPFLDLFLEHGFKVMGASAAKSGAERVGMPSLGRRLANIRAWGRHIARRRELGVVATAWSRNSSLHHPYHPFDTMWYSMVASAQYDWAAEGASIDRFQALFDREFFGLDDDGWLARALEATSEQNHPAALRAVTGANAERNRDVLQAYRICARVQDTLRTVFEALPRRMLSHYLSERDFIANRDPSPGIIEAARRRAGPLEREARRYYRSVMLREEADELADSQFGFFRREDFGVPQRRKKRTRRRR